VRCPVLLRLCDHDSLTPGSAAAETVKQLGEYAEPKYFTGKDFEPIIEPTADALKAINPQHIVPTHCTGRKAVMHLEKEMPDKFLLNMSGTKMIFAG